MSRQEINGEITACKSLLANSDYAIIKSLENLLACTSVTDFIEFLKGATAELLALKDKRQAWRDKINELEAQLATMTNEETEPVDNASPDAADDAVAGEAADQVAE